MPLQPADMGRDALPAPVAKLPIVGVTPAGLCAVCLLVAGARVNDCEVAKDADQHVVLANVLDRRTATNLGQKCLAVDQGAIGIGVEEVGREIGLKPGDIAFIDGSDVVAVEFPQGRTVSFNLGHGCNSLWLERQRKVELKRSAKPSRKMTSHYVLGRDARGCP